MAPVAPGLFRVDFTGEVIFWRGPSPYHFVAVPEPALEEVASWSFASYGWGCLPVHGRLGRTDFRTSLFPKDGGFVVPIKAHVRRAEDVDLGDVVRLRVDLVTEGIAD
ncbi:DUF1905 domain-containing protein [Intrasporangium flavum]|uniref:DUF1905 domain-containing protein n=1 Tax=Intrasporangium flavum TaxID=1428657 RepID=UPI001F617534|nr:DUF1905 domain-containing protein [Intrasporangium flavum]